MKPMFSDVLLANSEQIFMVLACASIGGAILILIRMLLAALDEKDSEQGVEWRYDVKRVEALRRGDLIYRLFRPVIGVLSRVNRGVFRQWLPEIEREIQAAGLLRYWLAEEYLARAELIALFLSPGFFFMCIQMMGPPGSVMAIVLTILTAYFQRHRLATRAKNRLVQIKRRLPFLLDLMTLLMEAGSTFLGALEQGVGEYRGHAIAQEFGRVLADMNMGKTRVDAFEAMKNRLSDEEISSIVGAIIQAEQLGTPLVRIFRTQADVLRIKRSQRAEILAGEAGVHMLLPGVIVMMSTVLIILGPFVINMINSDILD